MIIHSNPGTDRWPDDPLHDEREEFRSLRDAEDCGGYRRIAGRLVEDWPSADEIGELA